MTKLSLHVGINSLNAVAYNGFTGRLQACENDATAMAAIAASNGYVSIGTLTKDATRHNFENLMASAAEKCDEFFLTYSGHGTQWWLSPTEVLEAFCFYDGVLTDREFIALLHLFKPSAKVVCVLDCCYSGGMDKALSGRFKPKSLPKWLRLPEPPVLPVKNVEADVTLLCACSDAEVSFDGYDFGVWSGALIKAWSKDLSVVDWFNNAAAVVTGQTPQLKKL